MLSANCVTTSVCYYTAKSAILALRKPPWKSAVFLLKSNCWSFCMCYKGARRGPAEYQKQTGDTEHCTLPLFPSFWVLSVGEKGAARTIMIVSDPGLTKQCGSRQSWCHTSGGNFCAMWTIASVSHFVFSLSSAHANTHLDQVQLQRQKHFSEEGFRDGSV